MITHAIVHQTYPENALHEHQLHEYKSLSAEPPQKYDEQRKIRSTHVIHPIDIPKKSYQELQEELCKTKRHIRPTDADLSNDGLPCIDETNLSQNDINQAPTLDRGSPDVASLAEDRETSRKSTIEETNVVVLGNTVHNDTDGQVTVSLTYDGPEKSHILSDIHLEENRSDNEVF